MNKNLRIARIKCNLTQKQLSEIIGVSPKYLSCIETKGVIPSAKIMSKIAENLNRTVDELFFSEIKVGEQKNELSN